MPILVQPSSTLALRSGSIADDDFDDILLHADPKDRAPLPRPISTITRYSDSSISSISSTNSGNSSATDDEDLNEEISLDNCNGTLMFARSYSAHLHESQTCPKRYASSPSSSDDYEDSSPIAANKLNGYALNSLKAKTSISLLNHNQVAVNSRYHSSNITDFPPLFRRTPSLSHLSIPISPNSRTPSASLVAPNLNLARAKNPNSTPPERVLTDQAAPNKTKGLLVYPTSANKYMSSQLQLSFKAQQPFRTKSWTRLSTTTEPNLEENLPEHTDKAGYFPSSKQQRDMNLPPYSRAPSSYTYGAAQLPDPSRNRLHKDYRSKSLTSQPALQNQQQPSAMVLPFTRQGLTPQQRLRLRRHSAGGKLSVEQLELQCDSDDDGEDDIPEHSVMWNIPLSPALYTKAQQDRPKAARPKSAPGGVGLMGLRKSSAAESRRQSSGLLSIKESEATMYFSSTGLEQLSEDARTLTRAFQELSSTRLAEQLFAKQANQPSTKLPPKRRSNDPLDPVPMSKEKAAVLSRTRPSWLPPKSVEEETRHLHEFRQMMEQASAAEKAQEDKKKKKQMEREKLRQKDVLEWEKTVLPCLDKAAKHPKARKLWWRGIPEQYRGMVWKAQAGNNLGITQATYETALRRGRQEMARLKALPDPSESEYKRKQVLDLLVLECSKARSTSQKTPVHPGQLTDLLLAVAHYRPATCYKQGLHLAASAFLRYLSPLDAFIALCNTMDLSLCQALYLRDDRTLTAHYTSFLKVLNAKLPSLYRHFKSIHLPPSAYLEPMLSSLFAAHTTPAITDRIWDIMLFEGESFLLRVALGVLMKVEHRLYVSPQETLALLGWGAGQLELGDEDEFINLVRSALKSK